MSRYRRLRIADTEGTDSDFSGALAIGAHPDSELEFEDGAATAEAELAEQIADRYPNLELGDTVEEEASDAPEPDDSVEDADEDGDEGDQVLPEPPIEPDEYSVDELRDELDDADYSDGQLDAIEAAEQEDGSPRSTALDAIDAAREA